MPLGLIIIKNDFNFNDFFPYLSINRFGTNVIYQNIERFPFIRIRFSITKQRRNHYGKSIKMGKKRNDVP